VLERMVFTRSGVSLGQEEIQSETELNDADIQLLNKHLKKSGRSGKTAITSSRRKATRWPTRLVDAGDDGICKGPRKARDAVAEEPRPRRRIPL